MNQLNYVLIFLSILNILSFSSCNDDEVIIIEEPTETSPIDIGTFTLLEESINQLPYLDKSSTVFVDSLGNEATFNITVGGLFQNEGSMLFRYDVFELGDTVRYQYSSQSKTIRLVNDSLSLDFSLNLTSKPYAPDPESGAVADVLNIFCQNPLNSLQSFQVFYHETNSRTYPSTWNGINFPEINFIDRTFTDVHFIDFVDPKSIVYFNYEFGIISFSDANGKLWRFERCE